MPWYYLKLDPDLEYKLSERQIKKGTFLDLGTGPRTQAIELAKRGFNVTASDISDIAIEKAKEICKNHETLKNIPFLVDNIINSQLPSNNFDFVLDRGLFTYS